MAGFSVDILANINLKGVEEQIKNLNGTKITLNNFDLSGLQNAVQRELSSGRFSIRVDNIDLQNMTQQMGRAGTQAGQEFSRAMNSTLGNITSRNSAHTMRGLEQALAGFKFDRAQIDQITRGFDEMNIAVTRVRQNIHQQGRFRLNVEGVDEFGNIVTIVKELNNQTGELTTISKHINQSFTEIANGGSTAFNGVSKLIDEIGSKSKQILNLDPQIDTAEIETLENQLADLRSEYLMTMEAFGQDLNANQLRQIDAKWRKQDRELAQINAQNVDAAALAEQNAQIRQQADAMRQLVKVRQQMDNSDVNIAKLELAGGHDNQLAELRVTKSQLEAEYTGLFSSIDLGTADDSQILKLAESCEKAEAKIRELTAASKDKIDLNIGNQIDGFEKKVDGIKASFTSVTGSGELFSGIDEGITKLKEFQQIMKNNPVGSEAYQNASTGFDATFKSLNTELVTAKENAATLKKALSEIGSGGNIEKNISNIVTKFNSLGGTDNESLSNVAKVIERIKNLQSALNNPETSSDIKVSSYKELTAELQKAANMMTVYQNSVKGTVSALDITTAQNKMKQWLQDNTKAAKDYGDAINRLIKQLDGLDTNSNDAAKVLKDVNKEFDGYVSQAKLAGKTGTTWFDQLGGAMKSISKYVSASEIIYKGIETVKEMYSNVVEIDSAMTSLKKVTDETDATYDAFLSRASENAVKLGRTVSSLVEQTATWSKLGFTLPESEQLSQISAIYANVGEVSDETAVSDMVTAMKGFGLETQDAMSIVDALNALGKVYCPCA